MRILRWITLGIVGLIGLVVLVVAGVLLSSDRESVRSALRPRLETLLSDALRLDVKIGDLAGLSLWKGIRVRDVTLSHDGEPLIAADTLYVRLGLERVLPPLVSIRAEGEGVAVDLAQRPDGTWNIVQAFSSEEEAEKSPPPSWLDAIEVALRGGTVRITGLAEQPLALSAIDADASIVLGDRLTVEQLAARFGDASSLTAQGWLGLGDDSPVELALEVKPLVGADLEALVPQIASTAALTGTVQVKGSLDEPVAEVHVASGPATVDLWARVVEEAAGQRVVASAQVLALDPAQLVDDAPPASVSGAANVDVVLAEGEDMPRALQADLRLWSTSVADAAADWVTAQARRDGDRILLDAQLAAPNGAASAELASWVGVAEPHAAAGELHFALVRPAELPDPVRSALADSELRGRLTAQADRLAGEDRVVRAELQLERGRLRGVPLDLAHARGALEHGVASLDELRVEGGATKLVAWGWTQLEGPPEDRHLRAGFFGPVDLGLVPDARGKVTLRGNAWGTMAAIDADVKVASEGTVKLPAASGTFTIDARASGVGSERPAAEATLDARLAPDAQLASAIGGAPRDVDLKVAWRRPASGEPTLVASGTAGDAGAPDQVTLQLAAKEPDRRRHAFAGMIERHGETIVARLDELRVTPPRGPAWTLLQTAQVSYAPDRIAAQGVEIGSRAGRVALDGALVRDGRNDLSLTVADLDLAAVCTIAGLEQACGGDLDASLRLAGTTQAPALSGSVRVRDLALSGERYGGADLTLATEERLVVRGTLGEDPLGPLTLAARVPLRGGWPAPTVDPQGRIDATVTGNDIQLAGFKTFAADALTDLGGQADLEVRATGTLSEPELAGGITASGVRLGLAATGTHWKDGRLRVSFVGQAVRVEELAFDDGKGGSIRGDGELALTADDTDVDVDITLSSLEVFARREMDADVSGNLSIGGSVLKPRITGRVRVDSATIRPAFLPGGSGPPPDPTIEVVYADTPPETPGGETIGDALAKVPAEPKKEDEPAAPTPFFDRVSMAITVTLGNPVAVQRIDAYVRLDGEVYVTKEPGDALRISGQIYSERGWYLFRGRRIVLREAYVSFSGETPIDPYLTVAATYQAPEYLVTVRVEGTATKPELELSSDPPLDQSDVLALLLFGKTTSQLTGGQGTELRQEAIGILASYVAPELEQSLMDTFGLASLTFQLPTGTSYGSVGVGRYFGDDIFVSIGQTFGGPQGGTSRQLGGLVGSSVLIQYYLTPNITLQTSSSTEGESALDAIWHTRY